MKYHSTQNLWLLWCRYVLLRESYFLKIFFIAHNAEGVSNGNIFYEKSFAYCKTWQGPQCIASLSGLFPDLFPLLSIAAAFPRRPQEPLHERSFFATTIKDSVQFLSFKQEWYYICDSHVIYPHVPFAWTLQTSFASCSKYTISFFITGTALCLCFQHHDISTRGFVVEEQGTYEGAICVIHIMYACNLYIFVFIYPLETFFCRGTGYVWRGTLCMSTYGGALCACLRPIMTPRGCNLCCLTLYIRAPWFYKYSRKIFTSIYDWCATIYKL